MYIVYLYIILLPWLYVEPMFFLLYTMSGSQAVSHNLSVDSHAVTVVGLNTEDYLSSLFRAQRPPQRCCEILKLHAWCEDRIAAVIQVDGSLEHHFVGCVALHLRVVPECRLHALLAVRSHHLCEVADTGNVACMPTSTDISHSSTPFQLFLYALEYSHRMLRIAAIVAPLHDAVSCVRSHDSYFYAVFLKRQDGIRVLQEHHTLLCHPICEIVMLF